MITITNRWHLNPCVDEFREKRKRKEEKQRVGNCRCGSQYAMTRINEKNELECKCSLCSRKWTVK